MKKCGTAATTSVSADRKLRRRDVLQAAGGALVTGVAAAYPWRGYAADPVNIGAL
jgi:branched-chain amino acid transport system substrate-binding protein